MATKSELKAARARVPEGHPRDDLVKDVLHRFDNRTTIKLELADDMWLASVVGSDEGASVDLRVRSNDFAGACNRMREIVRLVAGW